jgi:hypothetical protein
LTGIKAGKRGKDHGRKAVDKRKMDLDNHTDFVCGIYFSQFSDAGRRIIQAERRRASDDPWDGSVDRDGGKLDH